MVLQKSHPNLLKLEKLLEFVNSEFIQSIATDIFNGPVSYDDLYTQVDKLL